MTRSDTRQLATGAALGAAAFLTFWLVFRRMRRFPVVDPRLVQWEGP